MSWHISKRNGINYATYSLEVLAGLDYDSMLDAYHHSMTASPSSCQNPNNPCYQLCECIQTNLVHWRDKMLSQDFALLKLSTDKSPPNTSPRPQPGETFEHNDVTYQFNGTLTHVVLVNFSVRQTHYLDKINDDYNRNGLIQDNLAPFAETLNTFIYHHYPNMFHIESSFRTTADLFSDKKLTTMFSMPGGFNFIDRTKLAITFRLAQFAASDHMSMNSLKKSSHNTLPSTDKKMLLLFDDLFIDEKSRNERYLLRTLELIKEYSIFIPASIIVVPIGFWSCKPHLWQEKSAKQYSKKASFQGTSPLRLNTEFKELADLFGWLAQWSYLNKKHSKKKFHFALFVKLLKDIKDIITNAMTSTHIVALRDATNQLRKHYKSQRWAMLNSSSPEDQHQIILNTLSPPQKETTHHTLRERKKTSADNSELAIQTFVKKFKMETDSQSDDTFDDICRAIYNNREETCCLFYLFYSDAEWATINKIYKQNMRLILPTSEHTSYKIFKSSLLSIMESYYCETTTDQYNNSAHSLSPKKNRTHLLIHLDDFNTRVIHPTCSIRHSQQ